MISNVFFSLYLAILPIVGGIIGYYIKYFVDINNKKKSKIYRKRRELYLTFVSIIISMNSNKNFSNTNYKLALDDFFSKNILYSSPEVINAISNFLVLINNLESDKIQNNYKEQIAKILYFMRKDLGLSNKNLGKNGINILKSVNIN